MNKIEKLIQELCPEGVTYLMLKSVASIKKGTQVNRDSLSDVYPYPVFNGGVKPSGRHKEFNFPANTVIVSQGGSAGFVNFVGEPLWVGAHCYAIVPLNQVRNRWLYFVLKNAESSLESMRVGATIPALNLAALANFVVPVPPLKIQDEILKNLEVFAESIELLEKEAQLRGIQSTALFNLAQEKSREDLREIKLGQLGTVVMCKRVHKHETQEHGEIPFYKIGTFGGSPDSYITQELFDSLSSRYSFPKKGDVLISASGTIGKLVVYDGSPSYFQDSNIVWIANDEKLVSNSYLYFLIRAIEWKVEGSTIQRLYTANLRKQKVKIPPLEQQLRISQLLNKLDDLRFSANLGIDAEIQARRKQFEYYRNKLLTFKELDAA